MNKIYLADIRSHTPDGKIKTGHCPMIARMYQDIFGDTRYVIIAGGPVYSNYFKKEDTFVLPYNVSGDSIIDKCKTFINCRRLFKKAEGEILVMQSVSPVTLFMCIPFAYRKKSKLYLIQYNTFAVSSRINRFFYRLAKWAFNGLICPNDYVGEKFGIPYCVTPDYIYTGDNTSKNSIDYQEKIYDFCMIGRLAEDKGIVEAAQRMAHTNYRVLIAGSAQTPKVKERLELACQGAQNIDLRIGFVADNDYVEYLHQSKYAILNYMGEYSDRSSGVVFDTLFNNVPVVGRRCRALQFIEDKGLGIVFDDIENFDPAIVMDRSFHTQCIQNIVEYRKEHVEYKHRLRDFVK